MDASSVLTFRLDVLCDGCAVSWMADGSWSIDDVKAKLEEMEGTHPDQQMLYFEGKLLQHNNWCLFDLKPYWDESDVVVSLEMEIMWLPCMTTMERDEARSRSRTRSPVPSDLGNENCIF